MVIISSGFLIFLTVVILNAGSYFDELTNYLIFILTSIAIIGGVLLLKDQIIGGILAIFCGGIGAFLFFPSVLFLSSSSDPLKDVLLVSLVLSGVMAVGGLIGLITDPDLMERKGKVLKEFLTENTEEIFIHYKVKKITFWRIYLEGYGLLVNFYPGVNESTIIELITSLETNFHEKIYLISKTGLIQSPPAKNKYFIYNVENDSLQIDEELIEPK